MASFVNYWVTIRCRSAELVVHILRMGPSGSPEMGLANSFDSTH